MATTYSTYEAKARFSEILRRVREGRSVNITYHGEVVAEIRPAYRVGNPKCLPFLKEKLSTLIQGLDPYVNELNHDRCDALLTAYTGYLHQMQLTDSLGADEEGFITMPQLPK